MDLIVWRHADAEDRNPGGDLSRALTVKGEAQAAQMAAWLNARLDAATRVIASPALRCQQTAAALGRDVATVDAIVTGASGAAVLQAAGWPGGDGAVLVVGHQPTLGLAVSLALSGSEDAWSVKKAGVWWLRGRSRDGISGVVVHAVQAPDGL